jgi:hypothetical protein
MIERCTSGKDSTKFRFKEFRVYQDAKDYCRFCRDIIKRYIEKHDKALANQIERAISSIVLNIAISNKLTANGNSA